jgi:hypothetical protein
MRLLVLLCFIALNLSAVAFSKESSPREPKGKTETSKPDDKKSDESQSYAYSLPSWISGQAPAPIINIFTAKHAGEKSECVEPKDWKEWGSFSRCRGLEWIDAERVIAIFTVILGFATWALWRSTDKLVTGAEDTAKRQLRAYVFPSDCSLLEGSLLTPPQPHRANEPAIAMAFRNSGNTPAKNAISWAAMAVIDINNEHSLIVPKLEVQFSITLAPNGIFTKTLWFGRALTSSEIEDVQAGIKGIYLYGRVEYLDCFGEQRFSNFRVRYTNSRFPPVPPSGSFNHCQDGNESD